MKKPASSENNRTILVVDDNVDFLNEVRLMLASNDFNDVMTLSTSTDLPDILKKGGIAVLLMDWVMPGLSGADLLPMLIQRHPHIPVIIMTAVHDLQTVVGCIKQGAFDYITKPIDNNRLLSSISKAFQINELATQNRRLKDFLLGNALLRPEVFDNIITASPRMHAIFKIVESMAGSGHPVLITGETGVGKEMIARAVHLASGLKGAFVPLNVAGLADMVFADTLFGHRKGAYTGANETRQGLIAKAEGGTLFLDEIGDLGNEAQMKLLRLLQEREYYRLGSDALIKSTARVVAASNRDFEEMMANGQFRPDLYHRLRNHHIQIPALRDRPEDIPLLIDHFLQAAATSAGKPLPVISREARKALEAFDYPGNVRQLLNLIQHAVSCNSGGSLTMHDFPGIDSGEADHRRLLRIFRSQDFNLQASFPTFPSMNEVEQVLIEEALRMTEGNKKLAAELLGISRQTISRKIECREEAG